MPANLNPESWTYGVEHEFSDWDTQIPLPTGFQRSPDYTIVNSNGIAAQPNPKVYRYGGEINTPPSKSCEEQGELLKQILDLYPNLSINHRSNLHCHVRVPGLKNDLPRLKQLQKYIHDTLKPILSNLEPIPKGTTDAERKRERRRRVSHQTFLTEGRLQHQLNAITVQEFFEREVPRSRAGKPMWHAQPRLAVGLRQLLQTDTIEFRHFPGTLSPTSLVACLVWCQTFLSRAFKEDPIVKTSKDWPTFSGFDFPLEVGYQATAANNGLSQKEIRDNIQLILNGEFHGSEAERIATAKAEGRTI